MYWKDSLVLHSSTIPFVSPRTYTASSLHSFHIVSQPNLIAVPSSSYHNRFYPRASFVNWQQSNRELWQPRSKGNNSLYDKRGFEKKHEHLKQKQRKFRIKYHQQSTHSTLFDSQKSSRTTLSISQRRKTALSVSDRTVDSSNTGHIMDDPNNQMKTQIAIIGGGGASGLATCRAFQKYMAEAANGNANTHIELTVFEKSHAIGGVWNYSGSKSTVDSDDCGTSEKNHPMYRNLRTNLPKEIMGFREYPKWPKSIYGNTSSTPATDNENPSFIKHQVVLDYLNEYANHFHLKDMIQFGCTVQKLFLLAQQSSTKSDDYSRTSNISLHHDNNQVEYLPKVELQWTKIDNTNGSVTHHSKTFDGVVICNGHYSKPAIPSLAGLDQYYQGAVMHSIQYDRPEDYIGQDSVLCVGARASGADIAREIASCGTHVYLSDSTYKDSKPLTQYNVTLVPRTKAILPNGCVQFDYECSVTPKVDTIMFCSGYDYDFPFVQQQQQQPQKPHQAKGDDNIDKYKLLPLSTTNRCVTPLYEQLWHAVYPNIAFIGIPHSILPFPLFELQAEAVAYQWTRNYHERDMKDKIKSHDNDNIPTEAISSSLSSQSCSRPFRELPNRTERETRARIDALSGGPEPNGRVPQDTHYLGSHQWDYCRSMAQYADSYSNELEQYLLINKAIYEHVGKNRVPNNGFPAGPDNYRSICYERNDNFYIDIHNGKDKVSSFFHHFHPCKTSSDTSIIVTSSSLLSSMHLLNQLQPTKNIQLESPRPSELIQTKKK